MSYPKQHSTDNGKQVDSKVHYNGFEYKDACHPIYVGANKMLQKQPTLIHSKKLISIKQI